MSEDYYIGQPCEGLFGIPIIDNFINGSAGMILMFGALIVAVIMLIFLRKKFRIEIGLIFAGLAIMLFVFRTLTVCYP